MVNDNKNNKDLVSVDSLQGSLRIVPAIVEVDFTIFDELKERIFDRYSPENIEKMELELNNHIENNNFEAIELFVKQCNKDLKDLKDVPKVIKDFIKKTEKEALEPFSDLTNNLKRISSTVEGLLVNIKSRGVDYANEIRRDHHYENVSLPIINKVLDEFINDDRFNGVDFSNFRIKDEDDKSFRMISYSKDSIELLAKNAIREFADNELAKIKEEENRAMNEQLLQYRERDLFNDLKSQNNAYNTNVGLSLITMGLRKGLSDDEIKKMYTHAIKKEIISRKVESTRENVFVSRFEVEFNSLDKKSALLRFLNDNNIKFREF